MKLIATPKPKIYRVDVTFEELNAISVALSVKMGQLQSDMDKWKREAAYNMDLSPDKLIRLDESISRASVIYDEAKQMHTDIDKILGLL